MSRQQRYRSRNEWKTIISNWKRSGLTGPVFSQRNGLNLRSLYRWSARLGKQPRAKARSESILQSQAPLEGTHLSGQALRIVPVPSHLTPFNVEAPKRRKSPSLSLLVDRRFRIVVPDGFSPDTLGKLLQALEVMR